MRGWIALAVLLAFCACGTGGYFYGKHVESAERDAAIKKDQDKRIEEANDNVAIDMAAAAENEKQRGQQREKALERRYQLEIDIERAARQRAQERPDCPAPELDAESYRLLVDSITAANQARGAGGVPEGVRGAAGSARRPRSIDPPLPQ